MSQGKTKALFRFGLCVAAVYSGAFLIGLHWNVEGVAVAYSVAVLLVLYPGFAIAFRFIDLPFWHFVRQFVTIALASGGMALVILGTRVLVEKAFNLGDLPVLVIGIIVGAAVYLGILLLIDRKLLKGLVEIVRDLKKSEELVV